MDIEILKISKYKGRLVTMYYRIRRKQDAPEHNTISHEWMHGSIRLDMTRIFSAVFQKWYDLRYDASSHEYRFDVTEQDKNYVVVDEVVQEVERINTEYLLLGKEP
jgi:hypothetical protein